MRSVVRSILAFAAAVIACSVCVPLGAAAPADADQPIDIRADSAELDDAKGIVVYRGNVRNAFVVEAGSEFKTIAVNHMNELLMATPAISHGAMFVRTVSSLVAIGRK